MEPIIKLELASVESATRDVDLKRLETSLRLMRYSSVDEALFEPGDMHKLAELGLVEVIGERWCLTAAGKARIE